MIIGWGRFGFVKGMRLERGYGLIVGGCVCGRLDLGILFCG